MIASLMPWTLMSICRAVMPSRVPVTLKSMSPTESSLPRMSVRTTNRPSGSLIRPIAAPATGAVIGTPASMRARVEPQVEAIEVEPFDDMHSDTSRMTYGNSSWLGRTGMSARSAEVAVPDVAPAGAAHRLVLAGANRAGSCSGGCSASRSSG